MLAAVFDVSLAVLDVVHVHLAHGWLAGSGCWLGGGASVQCTVHAGVQGLAVYEPMWTLQSRHMNPHPWVLERNHGTGGSPQNWMSSLRGNGGKGGGGWGGPKRAFV